MAGGALALVFLALLPRGSCQNDSQTPALFVFGDSLVDAGNNNYLNTFSRANFPPFGMNFDQHRATGRFTDGRLIPDYIGDASFLNLPFPPPYLGAGGNVLQGANFGSGGAGIHNSTGAGMGDHAPLYRQIEYFREAKEALDSSLGAYNSSLLVSKSIFYISIGNNDFANNYYRNPTLQRNYTLDQFEDLLISILRRQIKELYGLNARKFVISSVAALGCNPMSLYIYRLETPGQCASDYDGAARSYNRKLHAMVEELRLTLIESHMVYANLYEIMTATIKNGTAHGFSNVNTPCCPFGSYFECFMFAPTCTNASEHVFWDLFHPTGRFNHLAARRFWFAAPNGSDVWPFNIHHLSKL
ncbi:hypothetical protein SELMODRAFT_127225 [Selaginella moellendorffii]|uniref:Uncharacterized protein n=1 Tax=Selaginella moellendorffii TaxID=88036 RepID=D8SXS1_SELML|nr:hypothetical protein SELMODRAFT_127225 [Selaginella moellendorffii]